MGMVPRSGRPASLQSAARRVSPSASRGISSGRAPFCGPKTGAAPSGPSSGVATSASAITRAASPQPDANAASSTSDPPPSGSGLPSVFSNVHPSPRAAPVPPSTVAVPPSPTTTDLAPRSTAVQISSPTPRVVVRSGSRSSGSTSARPHAEALSMIAVSPSIHPSSAETGSPIGPVTGSRSRSAPTGNTTSSRPFPPSATGHSSTEAPGSARRTPVAIASAT